MEWLSSNEPNSDCKVQVEVGCNGYYICVRSSLNPSMELKFMPSEWENFIQGVKSGLFDFGLFEK